jgi:hypothetical protein
MPSMLVAVIASRHVAALAVRCGQGHGSGLQATVASFKHCGFAFIVIEIVVRVGTPPLIEANRVIELLIRTGHYTIEQVPIVEPRTYVLPVEVEHRPKLQSGSFTLEVS